MLPRDVVLFAIGLICTVILLALQEAGKLKGEALYWLLALAAAMTLPLVARNRYILGLPKPWKYWASTTTCVLTCLTYWAIAIWIIPQPTEVVLQLRPQVPAQESSPTPTTRLPQGIPPERLTTKKEKKIPVTEKNVSAIQPPPPTVNNASGGIIVQGGTVTNPTVNNFGAPPVEFASTLNEVASDKEGLRRTDITLVPTSSVPAPFVIALEFDNPISDIYSHVLNVAAQMGGGPYRTGTHAFVTIGTGINTTHPLVVTVYSVLPVKLVGLPTIE